MQEDKFRVGYSKSYEEGYDKIDWGKKVESKLVKTTEEKK